MTASITTTARRPSSASLSALLALEPPRHCGLSTIVLIPGRHLIGSDPACSIRLDANGVQPRHALILVGENRTVVRSMDLRTWVNDGPVVEMALRHGDRLSIGPLTFRLRTANADEVAAIVAASNPVSPPPSVEPLQTELTPEPARTSHENVVLSKADSISVPSSTIALEPVITGASVDPTASTLPLPHPVVAVPSPPVQAAIALKLPVAKPTTMAPQQPQANLPPEQSSPAVPPAKNSPSVLVAKSSPVEESAPNPTRAAPPKSPASVVGPAQVGTTPVPPIPTTVKMGPAQILSSRLDEIQQRLADLQQSSDFSFRDSIAHEKSLVSSAAVGGLTGYLCEPTADPVRTNPNDDLIARERDLQSRHDELQRRADEIATQTSELQTRIASIAERESQVERQQEALVQEAEHLAEVAETARRNLAEEHRRLSAQWREWDEKYQRMSAELGNQCDEVERQRSELRAEAERIALSQVELQRLRANYDQERRVSVIERARLSSEVAEFEGQRTQFEVDRQRQMNLLSELETRLAGERRELDRERAVLEEERAAQARQLEHAQLMTDETRSILDDERNQLLSERQQLDSMRARIDQQSLDSQCGDATVMLPPEWNFEALQVPDDHRPSASFGTVAALPTPPPLSVNVEYSAPFNDYNWKGADPVNLPPQTSLPPISTLSVSTPPIMLGSESMSRLGLPEEFAKPPAQDDGAWWTQPGQQVGWPATGPSFAAAENVQTAVAAPPHDIANTLSAVNQQFGMPVGKSPVEHFDQPPAALPEWWKTGDTPSAAESVIPPAERGGWIVDRKETEGFEQTPPARDHEHSAADDSPVEDLRSQLARLFDLPDASTAAAAERESMSTVVEGLNWPMEPPASETRSQAIQSSSSSLAVSPGAIAEGNSQPSHPQPSYTPPSFSPPEEVSARSSGDEDSVEAFMARLLQRNRSEGDSTTVQQVEPTTNPTRSTTSDNLQPRIGEQTFLPDDLSHLLSEPKHKQDKQVVRDSLQSFRQVAHLSARSALARHSVRQLRNATIAKGVLLFVALTAVIFFLSKQIWGQPTEVWKLSGCCLAALLSGVEFHRSWRQLRKPITSSPAPETAVPATADQVPSDAADSPTPESSTDVPTIS